MFVEQFELITRFADNSVGLDIFPTYGEAYDAAILKAASDLPNETVVCFQINKSFVNAAIKHADAVEK